MRLDRRAFVTSLLLQPFASTAAAAASFQMRLNQAMGRRQGFAIVLDVASGKVLAEHRLAAAAQRLLPPGSVIKPFVLAALLESKAVLSSTQCVRTLRIDGRNLDCSHVEVGQPVDPVVALGYSCNNYFAQSVVRIEPRELVRVLMSFGLTSTTNMVPAEVTGRISVPNSVGSLQLLGLGESGIRVTVPEIASAYRRLALKRREDKTAANPLGVIFEGLAAATEYGTARLARPSSIAIAGKTGTATNPSGGRPHAWFAGYAPAQSPEIVTVIFLEAGSGGSDAAPVARQIFEIV